MVQCESARGFYSRPSFRGPDSFHVLAPLSLMGFSESSTGSVAAGQSIGEEREQDGLSRRFYKSKMEVTSLAPAFHWSEISPMVSEKYSLGVAQEEKGNGLVTLKPA